MRLFFYFVLFVLISPLSVLAQDRVYTRRVDRPQQQGRVQRHPTIYARPVDGVVPRAIRGGNPLQMLNPNAPLQYGTAEQAVMIEPYTGKWNGIRFFTIYFD
jgi:hypothetical protein